jgi:hypothetical protein
MRERKSLIPIVVLFFAVALVALWMGDRLEAWGFDPMVLFAGNMFLYLLTLASWFLLAKGMKAKNTAGFLRSFYGSFLMKFLFVAIVAFAYVSSKRELVNKPSLFTCMGLYLVYMFLETRAVLSTSKAKGDAGE